MFSTQRIMCGALFMYLLGLLLGFVWGYQSAEKQYVCQGWSWDADDTKECFMWKKKEPTQ